MTRFKLISGLLLIAALAGCSRGDQPTNVLSELFSSSKRLLAKEEAAAAPTVTRAALNQINVPLLEATIENRAQTAYLVAQRQRTDAQPGVITVWRSDDDVTLALRSGVLIATRGLRDDLLSASALTRDGKRQFVLHHGDNQSQTFTLTCQGAQLGRTSLDILGKAYATTHLRERCEGPAGIIQNDYWLDAGSGQMRQSRQWAGPTIGYIMLRVLEK